MLWEVLKGYGEADYNVLKKSILDCYPEVHKTRKYAPRDLEEIVEEYVQHPLRSENNLANYYRVFKTVAIGLWVQGDLSINEINKVFWYGLPDGARN